jgi:hypothetical protein
VRVRLLIDLSTALRPFHAEQRLEQAWSRTGDAGTQDQVCMLLAADALMNSAAKPRLSITTTERTLGFFTHPPQIPTMLFAERR